MTEPEMPDWIKEAMRRAGEPLDIELAHYLTDGPLTGTSLKHPLVFQVPFFEAQAYRANDSLAAKKAALEKAMMEKEWHRAIWLHERPYRASAFERVSRLISDDGAYWELLGCIYADTENFWQESQRWARFLTSSRPQQDAFMTEDEQEAFAKLPDDLTIYRGFNGRGKQRAWAWTLDRDKAAWFARRLNEEGRGKPPTIVTAAVPKQLAIGYLSRRGEEEVVIQPQKVLITRSEVLAA